MLKITGVLLGMLLGFFLGSITEIFLWLVVWGDGMPKNVVGMVRILQLLPVQVILAFILGFISYIACKKIQNK